MDMWRYSAYSQKSRSNCRTIEGKRNQLGLGFEFELARNNITMLCCKMYES